MTEERDSLQQAEELFRFLQGEIPDGYVIQDDHVPRLTDDQAWTVIWYLGNLFWQVPDTIERCDLCDVLYDSDAGGDCLDFGESPYFFCTDCTFEPEYAEKSATSPDSCGDDD